MVPNNGSITSPHSFLTNRPPKILSFMLNLYDNNIEMKGAYNLQRPLSSVGLSKLFFQNIHLSCHHLKVQSSMSKTVCLYLSQKHSIQIQSIFPSYESHPWFSFFGTLIGILIKGIIRYVGIVTHYNQSIPLPWRLEIGMIHKLLQPIAYTNIKYNTMLHKKISIFFFVRLSQINGIMANISCVERHNSLCRWS